MPEPDVAPAPLSGIRVVEFAAQGPVAHCGLTLAALGASVDRIDRPAMPAAARESSRLNALHRGRRSLVLDLRTTYGADVARRLMARADVLVEGHRPGTMERLGLGPEPAHDLNPRLVYARVSGWGSAGPRSGRPGHDINFVGLSGVLDAIGTSDSGPVPPLMLLGDMAGGGQQLALAILAALFERERSGRGQVIDSSILEGVMSLGTYLYGAVASGRWQARRGSNPWDTGAHWYNVYRTRDRRWLSVGAYEPHFYEAFLRGLGLDPVVMPQWDRAQWPAFKERIARILAEDDLSTWMRVYDEVEACVEPVLGPAEALEHPDIRATGSVVDSALGPLPRPVPRFSRSGAAALAAPPDIGRDQAQILGELAAVAQVAGGDQ